MCQCVCSVCVCVVCGWVGACGDEGELFIQSLPQISLELLRFP